MARATKMPSGTWRCKANYTDEDGKYRAKSFTADTKKEAEYMAAEFLMNHEHNKKPENKTIGELADQYLDSISNTLSPSTLLGYRKKRNAAFQDIMEVRAGFLTQQMYQEAVNKYAKGRSPKTVIEAHRLMCRVFETYNVDINEKKVKLPQKVNKGIYMPSTKEVLTIIEASKTQDIYLPVLLAALQGLRKSEVFGLTWNDIDLEKGTMCIDKALVQNEDRIYVIKPTKTYDSTRTLKLRQQVIDALPSPRAGNDPLIDISYEAFTSRYKRLMKKIGMEKVTFHSLRHYYASVAHLNNIPNKYTMQWMGHSTEDMLKKVYQHIFEDSTNEFDDRMKDFFDNLFEQKEA